MGHCCSKNASVVKDDNNVNADAGAAPPPSTAPATAVSEAAPSTSGRQTPAQSPWMSPYPAGIMPSPARTPMRKLRWPFPPPSPARPIMAAIRRRQGGRKPKEGTVQEADGEAEQAGERESQRGLDKNFGFPRNFEAKYEVGKEVGRGHFGHTCWAKGKKGEVKGQSVAVKIISKVKMTSAIAVEDVRREVKMLKSLSGNRHMLKFYEAFEDADNVYIVME